MMLDVELIREDLKKERLSIVLLRYNLTLKELLDIINSQETIQKKPRKHASLCNVYPLDSGRYGIRRVINGKTVYFGTYSDRGTAKKVKEKLIECDWDKKELPRIQMEVEG